MNNYPQYSDNKRNFAWLLYGAGSGLFIMVVLMVAAGLVFLALQKNVAAQPAAADVPLVVMSTPSASSPAAVSENKDTNATRVEIPTAPAAMEVITTTSSSSSSSDAAASTANTRRVTALQNLNVRSGPGIGYAIIGTLGSGQSAEVTGRNADGDWFFIGEGWVSGAYVEKSGDFSGLPVLPDPPLPTPTATAEPAAMTIDFRADKDALAQGECTKLRWDVENAAAVTLDGASVDSHSVKEVCPASTTSYELRGTPLAGDEQSAKLTIEVTAPAAEPVIEFSIDDSERHSGDCTHIRWHVENVSAVYIDGEGVVGDGSKKVCPAGNIGDTITYTMDVQLIDGTHTYRTVSVKIIAEFMEINPDVIEDLEHHVLHCPPICIEP